MATIEATRREERVNWEEAAEVGVCEEAATAPPDAVIGVAGDRVADEDGATATGVLASFAAEEEAAGEGERESSCESSLF